MTAAATELQKSTFVTLAGDAALVGLLGGGKIFDHAPTQVTFPYITFGRTSAFADGTVNITATMSSVVVWRAPTRTVR